MATGLTVEKPGPNIPDVALSEAEILRIQEIEQELGLNLSNKALLLQAFIHRSATNPDDQLGNNERLEFLGNYALGLVIRTHLFVYHDLDEGPMTKISSRAESTKNLAVIADNLNLTQWLVRSEGETKFGPPTDKQRCDVLEALIGAIFVDGGLDRATEFCVVHIIPTIRLHVTANQHIFNPQAIIRRRVIEAEGVEPAYKVIKKNPGFYSTFVIGVFVKGRELGRGEGTSKRLAEIAAAVEALKYYHPPWQVD